MAAISISYQNSKLIWYDKTIDRFIDQETSWTRVENFWRTIFNRNFSVGNFWGHTIFDILEPCHAFQTYSLHWVFAALFLCLGICRHHMYDLNHHTVQWEKRERLLDLMESAKRGKNVTCGQKSDRSLEFNRENSRCKNFFYKLCKFRIMPALSFIPYINQVVSCCSHPLHLSMIPSQRQM